MLWTQHTERYTVGGHTARRVPYFAFKQLTAGITTEDMAAVGRLNAKRASGAVLDQAETDRLTEIASRWPVDALRGACMLPPMTAQEVTAMLDAMPRAQAQEAEAVLDMCATPDVPEDELTDPLAVLLVARGLLAIDPADITVGQGYAITAMLAPPEVR